MKEFGYDPIALQHELRENIAGIRELIPMIQSLEQWQKIIAKADPLYREQIRDLIEPFLPFKVPGVEQAPEAAKSLVFDDTSNYDLLK